MSFSLTNYRNINDRLTYQQLLFDEATKKQNQPFHSSWSNTESNRTLMKETVEAFLAYGKEKGFFEQQFDQAREEHLLARLKVNPEPLWKAVAKSIGTVVGFAAVAGLAWKGYSVYSNGIQNPDDTPPSGDSQALNNSTNLTDPTLPNPITSVGDRVAMSVMSFAAPLGTCPLSQALPQCPLLQPLPQSPLLQPIPQLLPQSRPLQLLPQPIAQCPLPKVPQFVPSEGTKETHKSDPMLDYLVKKFTVVENTRKPPTTLNSFSGSLPPPPPPPGSGIMVPYSAKDDAVSQTISNETYCPFDGSPPSSEGEPTCSAIEMTPPNATNTLSENGVCDADKGVLNYLEMLKKIIRNATSFKFYEHASDSSGDAARLNIKQMSLPPQCLANQSVPIHPPQFCDVPGITPAPLSGTDGIINGFRKLKEEQDNARRVKCMPNEIFNEMGRMARNKMVSDREQCTWDMAPGTTPAQPRPLVSDALFREFDRVKRQQGKANQKQCVPNEIISDMHREAQKKAMQDREQSPNDDYDDYHEEIIIHPFTKEHIEHPFNDLPMETQTLTTPFKFECEVENDDLPWNNSTSGSIGSLNPHEFCHSPTTSNETQFDQLTDCPRQENLLIKDGFCDEPKNHSKALGPSSCLVQDDMPEVSVSKDGYCEAPGITPAPPSGTDGIISGFRKLKEEQDNARRVKCIPNEIFNEMSQMARKKMVADKEQCTWDMAPETTSALPRPLASDALFREFSRLKRQQGKVYEKQSMPNGIINDMHREAQQKAMEDREQSPNDDYLGKTSINEFTKEHIEHPVFKGLPKATKTRVIPLQFECEVESDNHPSNNSTSGSIGSLNPHEFCHSPTTSNETQFDTPTDWPIQDNLLTKDGFCDEPKNGSNETEIPTDCRVKEDVFGEAEMTDPVCNEPNNSFNETELTDCRVKEELLGKAELAEDQNCDAPMPSSNVTKSISDQGNCQADKSYRDYLRVLRKTAKNATAFKFYEHTPEYPHTPERSRDIDLGPCTPDMAPEITSAQPKPLFSDAIFENFRGIKEKQDQTHRVRSLPNAIFDEMSRTSKNKKIADNVQCTPDMAPKVSPGPQPIPTAPPVTTNTPHAQTKKIEPVPPSTNPKIIANEQAHNTSGDTGFKLGGLAVLVLGALACLGGKSSKKDEAHYNSAADDTGAPSAAPHAGVYVGNGIENGEGPDADPPAWSSDIPDYGTIDASASSSSSSYNDDGEWPGGKPYLIAPNKNSRWR